MGGPLLARRSSVLNGARRTGLERGVRGPCFGSRPSAGPGPSSVRGCPVCMTCGGSGGRDSEWRVVGSATAVHLIADQREQMTLIVGTGTTCITTVSLELSNKTRFTQPARAITSRPPFVRGCNAWCNALPRSCSANSARSSQTRIRTHGRDETAQ